MKRMSMLVLIIGFILIGCSTAEESDSLGVAFWLERITFTEVEWNDEVDSCVVSSDWISIQRGTFKNAIIRKIGWFYEIRVHENCIYWVKENPLDYLIK